jgi:hypothetical protein
MRKHPEQGNAEKSVSKTPALSAVDRLKQGGTNGITGGMEFLRRGNGDCG